MDAKYTSLSKPPPTPPLATTSDRSSRGGWTTAPFILASLLLLTVAAGCWSSNLIVFLIKEFNIKSINAAQISNVVNGCVSFFPLIGAILADSLLGSFTLIWISSLISLLGWILLMLTVTVDGLRAKINIEYAVLYSALTLFCVGVGGTRFSLATMGANQFTQTKHQSAYFNWYFFSLYTASFISVTAIVYLEDNFSWILGFGIGIVANALGLAFFLAGSRFYKPHSSSSPFTSLLSVLVASFRKRKLVISSTSTLDHYYYGDGDIDGNITHPPTNRFRWLNHAAVKTEGDILPNGKITNPWKISTVQQVEDLKSVIRILPLWSSSIFLNTPIGIQLSLTILQALTTNRHIHHSFQFPASSILVFSFVSTIVVIALSDTCFWPLWTKISGKHPTYLQQIGIGHVFSIASMALSALVESKRRSTTHQMSVAWLFPQMVVVGIGDAFHFPGQVGLYYHEFPSSLKNLATAMVSMLIGVAFYLSTALIHFITRVTDWLPDNINHGRLDYVYWVMVAIGIANFGYYLIISWLYTYNTTVQLVEGHQRVSRDEH